MHSSGRAGTHFVEVIVPSSLAFSTLIGGKKTEIKRTDKYNGPVKTVPHQMGKGFNGRKKAGNGGRGWSEGRKKYVCKDGVDVEVISKAFRLR